MIIDFQAHLYPEAYIEELNRLDGAVVLEAPDPHSGMTYFYDKQLKCRINTATFRGRDIERRLVERHHGQWPATTDRHGSKWRHRLVPGENEGGFDGTKQSLHLESD